MTTRFKEHDLTEGLTGAIHETGHSLYEQVSTSVLTIYALKTKTKEKAVTTMVPSLRGLPPVKDIYKYIYYNISNGSLSGSCTSASVC